MAVGLGTLGQVPRLRLTLLAQLGPAQVRLARAVGQVRLGPKQNQSPMSIGLAWLSSARLVSARFGASRFGLAGFRLARSAFGQADQEGIGFEINVTYLFIIFLVEIF